MYGNFYSRNHELFWKNKAVPLLLSKLTHHFSFPYTRFMYSDFHAASARAVAWSQLQVPFAYTLEASFFGHSARHFTSQDLQEVGVATCLALLSLFSGPKLTGEADLEEVVQTVLGKVKKQAGSLGRYLRRFRPVEKPVRKAPRIRSEPAEAAPKVEDEEGSDSDPERDELEASLKQELVKIIRNQDVIRNQDNLGFSQCAIVKNFGRYLPSLNETKPLVRPEVVTSTRAARHLAVSSTPEATKAEPKLRLRNYSPALIKDLPKHFHQLRRRSKFTIYPL